jgi:hypothetical protein
MTETTTHTNGITPTNTKETKIKSPRKPRYLPGLPSVSNVNDMIEATYKVLCDKTPTEFSSLDNYEFFCMSPDAASLMVKVSRSKAIRISDRKIFQTNGGRVYRASSINYVLPKTEVRTD